MKKDRFFTAVYCPPYPPKGKYPNRITEEVYQILKDVGIDHIFGHFEDDYGWNYVTDSMDICDKLGLTYYPRLRIYEQYLAITGGYHVKDGVTYTSRSEEEKAAIGAEFLRQVGELSHHPCFGGIYFGDESAYGAIEGIAAAKNLFLENYPDKEFHYNNLNYCFSDVHLFGGENAEGYHVLTGDMECKSENRFNRYRFLIDKYVDTVQPEYLTTDFYPFGWAWRHIPTSVHRGLYELNSIFADYKKKSKGMKSYQYMQVGYWDDEVRLNTRAELALQMNITLAYGHEGFAFFPGVFPNDFLDEPPTQWEYGKGGICGLVDAYGKATMYADFSKELLADLQAFAPIMLNSEFLGVATVGEYHNGFDGVDISVLPDNDALYTGWLPEWGCYEEALPQMDTNTQLFIGVFKQENGKKAYFVVNNSTLIKANATLKLQGKNRMIQKGVQSEQEGEISVCIPAGESILIY